MSTNSLAAIACDWWTGLLETANQVGDTKQARKLCERIAATEPNNVQIRFTLFEQARHAGDDAGMERALNEIEGVAGKGAYWLFGRAVSTHRASEGQKGGRARSIAKRRLGTADPRTRGQPNLAAIPC